MTCFQGLVVPLLLALPLSSLATTPTGTWNHDPLLNDAICSLTSAQYDTRVAPDGTGGWIVGWVDARGGGLPAIYVQRLNASGARLWATDGVLAFQTYGFLIDFEMTGDGMGGVFVATVDSHDALFYHVYLQRVSPAGARILGTGGVSAATGTSSGQIAPTLLNSEPGVAVVAFQDTRATGGDIYAQSVTSAGTLTWGAGGAAVCALGGAQSEPVAVPDGNGGALVFWEDERDSGTTGKDIYGQHLSAAGAQQWTAAGAVVSTASGSQARIAAAADGSGGALIVWEDERNLGLDIYGMRLNGSGTARWFVSGRPVCDAAGSQHDPVVAADPYGGAWVAWTDGRDDAWIDEQIYVQALAGDGLPRWTLNGQPAGAANGNQAAVTLAATDDGTVSLAWVDQRTGMRDVRAQRFDYGGSPQWSMVGLLVAGAAFDQAGPCLAAGSSGEVLVAWDDERVGQDIYAQRVDRTGWLGDPAPVLATVTDRPEDQGGQVRLSWNASWLDAWGQPGVTAYHVLNRRPGVKNSAPGTGPAVLKMFLADGWTEVSQVPPLQLSQYACNAPTYGDWTPGSQPLTEFMVVAEAGANLLPSGTLTGYSVDNLSPGAPTSLQVQSDHFDVLLAWQPSGVDDEDLHHYNVYRSRYPDFPQGQVSLLSDAALTSYFEVRVPQGHWYFRVTAVDIHGNESVPSNIASMLSLVAVDPAGLPAALAVRSATPNPFNPVTEIRCELPADGQVMLAIYDLGGHAVRNLLDESRSAGLFSVIWNGRDDNGRQVPSGVYFARLSAAGHESVLKLVLAK
jgi:hypothetical protein